MYKNWFNQVWLATIIGLFLGIVPVSVIFSVWAEDNANLRWKRITVERGLAQYCPKTGNWAWIGECK